MKLEIGTKGQIESYKTRNHYIESLTLDIVKLTEDPKKESLFIIDSPRWSAYTGAISIKVFVEGVTWQYYLAHTRGKIYVKLVRDWSIIEWWKNPTNTDKKNATFHVKPGLADPSWVSFESGNYPGCYLKLGYKETYYEWIWVRWGWFVRLVRVKKTRYIEKLCIVNREDADETTGEYNKRTTFRFI